MVNKGENKTCEIYHGNGEVEAGKEGGWGEEKGVLGAGEGDKGSGGVVEMSFFSSSESPWINSERIFPFASLFPLRVGKPLSFQMVVGVEGVHDVDGDLSVRFDNPQS